MNWIALKSVEQINDVINRSNELPCIIFKHSTRCSISSMAKLRFEQSWDFSEKEVEAYFLDLIQYRSVSNQVAETFSVHHESPQLLLVKKGECTYDSSHLDITVNELKESLPN